MNKKFLSLFLALCLLCSCTKIEEVPVEIPQESMETERIVEEESRIIGDYILLEGNQNWGNDTILELGNQLISYDYETKQLIVYSTDTGECLSKEPMEEAVLAIESCNDQPGYDYRIRCTDSVIYRNSQDLSAMRQVELPMGDDFIEAVDASASYDVYGSQLVYCDNNGDVYIGTVEGASQLLLSAEDFDPNAYENVSPNWQGSEYSGPHEYYTPQFLNNGERIMLKFRTGDDVLYGFVICDLKGNIIGGCSCPMQYGIYAVKGSKVAIHTGAFGYCLTNAETGETTDSFNWNKGMLFSTWDYETLIEQRSDSDDAFGPKQGLELLVDGKTLFKVENKSLQANLIHVTEHFVLVMLYPNDGEEQMAVVPYREAGTAADGDVPVILEEEEQIEELLPVFREVILDINAGDWESSDYQSVSLSCPEDMSVQSMGTRALLSYQEKYDANLFLYRDADGSMFQSQRYLQDNIGDIRDPRISGKEAILQVENNTFHHGEEVLQRDIYWLKLDGYCLKLQISIPHNDPGKMESVVERMLETVELLGPSQFPTEDEYTTLRQTVPYTEPDGWSDYQYPFQEQFPVDDTGEEIARVLQYTGIPLNYRVAEYDSATEIEFHDEHKLQSALMNTEIITVDDEHLYPQLEKIAVTVNDTQFYLKEHIEETARLLFGPDTVLTHKSFIKYSWFPKEGVYTPPHMGYGGFTDAVLLNYKDHGDYYEATAVYTDYLYYAGAYADENGEAIADEQFAEVIANQMPKYHITLGKGEPSPYVISAERMAP